MPFKSEKQRRYLYANEPKLAKKWSNMYGDKIKGLGGVSKYRFKNKEEQDKEYKSIFSWIGKWSKENKYDGNLKKHNKKFNKDYAKFLKSKNIPFVIREIKNGKKIPLHLRLVEVVYNPVLKQGYKDREDESLGMRRGAERGKKQSFKDRRNESYGKFGKRDKEKKGKNKINKKISGLGGLSTDEYLMRIASTLLAKGLNPSKYTKSKAKALLKDVEARKKVYDLIDKKSADITIYMKRIKNL